jgi:hypothetical protein
VFLRSSDGFAIPFSLLWGRFAIFWEYNVLTSKAPVFFGIWGIPFVLIGLYLIVGRFFLEANQRAKTYYGLTNQRVIVVSGLFSHAVKSLQLRTMADLSLTEWRDGNGTITFGATDSAWQGRSGWPGASRYAVPRFDSITGAREVFERVRAAQRDA